uniref:Uncharacterized protein n=1 Tax=Anguilla anguilla TaxID=7936 RepID=A0A0E9T6Y1_ANGAN
MQVNLYLMQIMFHLLYGILYVSI